MRSQSFRMELAAFEKHFVSFNWLSEKYLVDAYVSSMRVSSLQIDM